MKRTRTPTGGRKLLVEPEMAAAAWAKRGTRKLEEIAADFGVSRKAVENALNAAGIEWRIMKGPPPEPLTKPCGCGNPECIVVQREGEKASDFRDRQYATRKCQYVKPRKTASFGVRECIGDRATDDGTMLSRLVDVYGERGGPGDLPELGQLGRLVLLRNEYGRIVA